MKNITTTAKIEAALDLVKHLHEKCFSPKILSNIEMKAIAQLDSSLYWGAFCNHFDSFIRISSFTTVSARSNRNQVPLMIPNQAKM